MFNLVPMERRNRRLMDRFSRNFDRFFDSFENTMSTDIVDKGDQYELTCELPGLKKEDIKISIDDSTMTISVDQQMERDEKKDNYVLQERRACKYSRSFDIRGIDKDKISGSYKDGILQLNLPKLQKDEDEGQKYLEIDFGD
ncbi:MAG TPA: Hsp20 family protein [Clostridiaceae bacterium]|nr:Hsp20 family protein [Clostridiaceae bacterium]